MDKMKGRTADVWTEIQTVVVGNRVTVFWGKPEEWIPGCRFQVYVDGVLQQTVVKTHAGFTVPETQRQCHVKVKMVGMEAVDPAGVNPAEADPAVLWELPGKDIQLEAGRRRVDITKEPYLAKGDGKTLNTRAIQKAIDECGPKDMVYIPPGVFMTGALRLHSNMMLYIEKDATLQGTDIPKDYLPRIRSRFEGTEMECYSSLLNLGELDRDGGYNCRNVVICGGGTIASGGRELARRVIESERERLKDYLTELGDGGRAYENPDTIPGRVRPRLIHMSNCRNVVLSGLTLKNGASWNVQMIYSDAVVTNACQFHSEGVWNGDGWDPDSSTNCTVFDCNFYTGDDSVAIKSGKNPEGNRINRPSRHIRIFGCRSVCGHGIAIGSEISGGIEDVCIWDYDLSGSRYGIEIKATKKRGGYVREVHVRDCVIPRLMIHSVDYNDDGAGSEVPPVFENYSFERLHIQGRYMDGGEGWRNCNAMELCRFDEPGYELKQIVFREIMLGNEEGGKEGIVMRYCKGVVFEDIGAVMKEPLQKN
ncbi:glycoside hydrolase family 28 protein [Enterocloster aldenensis]|uniref:glycoside hydrolase family 28 protein n=1 Tax=Enterocloster aldenensis TaxID=358742 RepID=UPI001D06CFE3|nr:glycoside hydrolase family 28 protein [Enterocloster aldenensis]